MKQNTFLLTLSLLVALFLSSCEKININEVPHPNLGISENEVTLALGSPYTFKATAPLYTSYINTWTLDGVVVSTQSSYLFEPKLAGTYTLVYTGTNANGTFRHDYTVVVPVPVVAAKPGSSKYISKVFDYLPAPGQFINEAAVGSPEQAQKIVGGINSLLSLGAFGGYVVFGFDHSVVNGTGYDLAIYSNPISGLTPWAEPGIVMVSQDRNGNGLPDDEWFELAGSEYNDPSTIKNYEITYKNPKAYEAVTWTDNQGNSGVVDINTFHKHNYYPEFASNQESLTFRGTRLRSTFGMYGRTYINSPFSWGYADSASEGDNYLTNKYNGFDISWAVNDKGEKVALKTIDFVKVYTAQSEKGNGLLGEVSTEIKGAEDLQMAQ